VIITGEIQRNSELKPFSGNAGEVPYGAIVHAKQSGKSYAFKKETDGRVRVW